MRKSHSESAIYRWGKGLTHHGCDKDFEREEAPTANKDAGTFPLDLAHRINAQREVDPRRRISREHRHHRYHRTDLFRPQLERAADRPVRGGVNGQGDDRRTLETESLVRVAEVLRAPLARHVFRGAKQSPKRGRMLPDRAFLVAVESGRCKPPDRRTAREVRLAWKGEAAVERRELVVRHRILAVPPRELHP